jgi:hypothetical protein
MERCLTTPKTSLKCRIHLCTEKQKSGGTASAAIDHVRTGKNEDEGEDDRGRSSQQSQLGSSLATAPAAAESDSSASVGVGGEEASPPVSAPWWSKARDEEVEDELRKRRGWDDVEVCMYVCVLCAVLCCAACAVLCCMCVCLCASSVHD